MEGAAEFEIRLVRRDDIDAEGMLLVEWRASDEECMHVELEVDDFKCTRLAHVLCIVAVCRLNR